MSNGGGGQTAKDESGWTVDTLKEHLEKMLADAERFNDKRFEETERRYEQRFLAQEKAVNAALAAAENSKHVAERYESAWKAGANEWRGSMSDRERDFARKTDMEALKERMDRSEGKGAGLHAGWGYLVGGIGLLFTVISVGAIILKFNN